MARGSSPSPLPGGLGQHLIVCPAWSAGRVRAVAGLWDCRAAAGSAQGLRSWADAPGGRDSEEKAAVWTQAWRVWACRKGLDAARCPKTVTEGVRPGSDGTWSVFSL